MGQWYLRTQDETFGPESEEKLVSWAKLGRIQPGQEISEDNEIWTRVEDVPFLDMRFSIDLGDGNPRGPFNRAAAEALLASGRLPRTATMVETREPFAAPASTPAPAPTPAPAASAEPRVVEKVVEKIVEVPVEKIVEKVVEKEVVREVPVEKIVEKEVEKIVVDDRRIRELEGLLAEATRTAGESETALRDAKAGETLLREQICSLEDELRRLPQTASEIADLQAAVYSIMTGEADELAALLDVEKREAEEFRRRHEERAEKLSERRRELLKRAGANIEDMTRRALVERPEDPRMARLRKEYEDYRVATEKKAREDDRRFRELEEQLKIAQSDAARAAEGLRDVTEMRKEIEDLRLRLQTREKELLDVRQENDGLRRQQATSQQALMARLATLESPSIGTPGSISTNQSREAHLVKLPPWMRLGK